MYGYSIASAQILVCTLYHFRRWGLNMAMGNAILPQETVHIQRIGVHIRVPVEGRVMVHGYDQLTAQQFTVLGVLLRFGVHQTLAQQQVDSDAFPSLRHTLYIHTGGKADTVVVGQGEQEAGVEQTSVAALLVGPIMAFSGSMNRAPSRSQGPPISLCFPATVSRRKLSNW